MTYRSWAIKFMTDVLYECNQDSKGVHTCPRHKCRDTVLRHFRREIKRLVRRQDQMKLEGARNPFV